MLLYVHVIVPINIDKILTYHSEEELSVGALVEVQVLNQNHVAIVESFSNIKPNFTTKPILKIVHNNFYSEAFVQTIKWISEYYLCPIGLVFKNFFFTLPFENLPQVQEKESFIPIEKSPLTPEVEKVLEQLKTKKTVVVHGRTRFKVYNFFISRVLQNNGTVLILIPNNDYLHKISSFLSPFASYLLIFNSEDTSSKRKALHWDKVRRNDGPLLVVGTKNVLSLPFQKIDFLIIEEEQDDLYFQNKSLPYYNARNVFLYFGTLLKSKIILGTNSPSLTTFYNVKKKKYGLVELTREEEKKVEISLCKVNMGNQIFTGRSIQEMKKVLSEGGQVVVLQNKLGYYDNLTCERCKACYECKNCSVSLTFHKKGKIFICHHCGKSYKVLHVCEKCGSESFSRTETGIEKVVEELELLFLVKNILQVDADVLRRKKDKEEILRKINYTDLVVGTRAIEALNLDKVTLLVLPDFDRFLTDSDFFTNERLFNMLMKLREIPQEKMIIQTNIPEHTIFKNLNCQKDFYEGELADRMAYKYPPLSRFVKIECQHKNEKLLQEMVDKMKRELEDVQVEVVGYEKSKIFRVKKKFKMLLWVKVKKNEDKVCEVLKNYQVKAVVI